MFSFKLCTLNASFITKSCRNHLYNFRVLFFEPVPNNIFHQYFVDLRNEQQNFLSILSLKILLEADVE
ncbi:hypothetical protein CW304_09760 [Bacillus sp. UFRGS-B20]|nr:hypothetical protein CW304_09760 [Bacillus sp. UFRGS-B20]